MPLDLSASSGAIFSPCGSLRYLLWRRWDDLLTPIRWAMCIGANPSKANAVISDPTVSQMRGRFARLGFTGFIMANADAYVSTDPKGLIGVEDPCGPDNDSHILTAADLAEIIVCAWGELPSDERVMSLLRLLDQAGHSPKLRVLGVTAGGRPRHPRGVSLTKDLLPWEPLQI